PQQAVAVVAEHLAAEPVGRDEREGVVGDEDAEGRQLGRLAEQDLLDHRVAAAGLHVYGGHSPATYDRIRRRATLVRGSARKGETATSDVADSANMPGDECGASENVLGLLQLQRAP